jgi:murein DD-endopeptidase MepM/ murein hydrolase activator NlpD
VRPWLAAMVVAAALLALLPGAGAAATGSTPRATPTPIHTPKPTAHPTPSPRSTPRPLPAQRPSPTPRPISRAEARRARAAAARRLIEEARREIGAEVADSLASVEQLSEALNDNADQQAQLESQVEAARARLPALDREIQQRDADIADTQRRIDGERADIGVLARELYQQPDSLVLRMLRARSVHDAFTQAGDLTVAALRADTLQQRLSGDLDQLQQEQSDQQSARDQQTQDQAELAAALGNLQELERQERQTAAALQAAIRRGHSALAKVSRKKEKASVAQRVAARLQEQDQGLIAISEEQVWQQAQLLAALSGQDAQQPGPQAEAGSAGENAQFAWPIRDGVVTQRFGPTAVPLEPALYGFDHFHTGLDLASSETAVVAAADGVVAAVGSGPSGYGTYVIIDHGPGMQTLYGHLALAGVRAGQRVTRGQPIGLEGSTGASTGVHLHFEVRLDGRPVDPMGYLPAGT